ncbi:MAG: PLP-dependent lyase/thiolase [Candidatus Micrarchaeota archaeon]
MNQLRVGHTPLHKSIELCGRCNGAQVLVKREDRNPFSTFKDRRCAALLESTNNRNQVAFVQITTGNSGYSLGMMAEAEARKTGREIKVVNIIPRNLSPVIKAKLESCSIVYEMDLTDHIVTPDEMRAIAKQLTNFDEVKIEMVESYGLVDGYRQIVREIAADGVKPRYIFCPVGEGELFTELAAAAQEVWPEGTPAIIGFTASPNAILNETDFIKKFKRSVADKLVNGYSKFKALVHSVIDSGRGRIFFQEERQIMRTYELLNKIGIPVEPSAAAAFSGAMWFSKAYDLSPKDTVVIVNTGRGIFDQAAVEKHWLRKLKSAIKYAAIVVTVAAVTALAVWGYVIERTKFEILNRSLLQAQVLVYADKDRDNWLDEEEAVAVCNKIPGKNCDHPMAGPLIYGFEGFSDIELGVVLALREAETLRFKVFSDSELAYYREVHNAEANNDMIGREIARDIRYAYEHNRFWVKNGRVTWGHYDYDKKQWFVYSEGGERVYEGQSGMGDICRGKKNYPPSVCP